MPRARDWQYISYFPYSVYPFPNRDRICISRCWRVPHAKEWWYASEVLATSSDEDLCTIVADTRATMLLRESYWRVALESPHGIVPS